MSTVIPALDWADTLSNKIGITINAPAQNLPMFLIDSEGMGVRGAKFDFITTSPPAIIAKMVIWIGTENLQTAKILLDIDEYLTGLDNIVMEENKKEVFCSSPSYGHFIVVINKMMGSTPDDLLQRELMEPEPDYIEGSTERNEIRKKLQECFDGVTVLGLPTLTVPPGENIDYPILDGRFKDGLGKIVQSVMQRAENPRIVTVAGMSRELNASNAEVIIGTVVEEANKGQIDLTGFDSFWTYIKQDIIAKLGDVDKEFKPIAGNCEPEDNESGYHCSTCVCSYRNSIVDGALAQVSQILELARSQALSIYGVNLDEEINTFYEETIDPWQTRFTCTGETRSVQETPVCDISEMFATLNGRSHSSDVSCSLLFICGNSIISSSTTISTDGVYVADGASFQNTEIGKAQDGADASTPGEDGGDGSPGAIAPSLSLAANYKLPSSAGSVLFTSKGGSGGNGGNGQNGEDKTGGIPAGSETAKEVTETGDQYDYTHTTDKHCGGHCHTDDEYWYFKVEIAFDACGGNGGRGGNGGAGGSAGLLTISGNSGLTTTNNRLESAGGTAGSGAPGASGVNVARTYLGWHRHWEDAGCHGFGGLSCGPSYHDAWGGYSYTNTDTNCPGQPGPSGTPGSNWKP